MVNTVLDFADTYSTMDGNNSWLIIKRLDHYVALLHGHRDVSLTKEFETFALAKKYVDANKIK